jgi:hypothetical protein
LAGNSWDSAGADMARASNGAAKRIACSMVILLLCT